MSYDNILVTDDGAVRIITINRPPANTLSTATLQEIGGALDEAEHSDELRAVIITGAGQFIFVAGADIAEFTRLADPEEAAKMVGRGIGLFNRIANFPKPTIAAINGRCLGGGNELAMSCDFRYAAESAGFGQPEINLGIIPAWGGTARLVRIIGRSKGLELLLTGDTMKAADALRHGLVTKVVPDGELMSQTKNFARKLAAQAPLAIKAIKEAVNQGEGRPIDEAIAAEGRAIASVAQSEDAVEGVTAFLSKRRPQFKGR